MRSASAVGTTRSGVIVLEGSLTPYDLADLARTAALEFMHGTNTGWSARDLAAWLAGSYTRATRSEAPATSGIRSFVSSGRALHGVGTERLLLDVRETVLFVIETFSRPVTEVSELVAAQHVRAARDANGGALGYIPIATSEMRLVDRVSSLLVADFMTRPNDYKQHVLVCDGCGEVSFDWAPVHLAGCTDAGSDDILRSGVVCRRSDGILPGGAP